MAWFVSRRNCPSFLTANTVAGPLDGAHRSGRATGNHQDPPTTRPLSRRTAHPLGPPPHLASAPGLALGKPVQSHPGPIARSAAPFLTPPSASDPSNRLAVPRQAEHRVSPAAICPTISPSATACEPSTSPWRSCLDPHPPKSDEVRALQPSPTLLFPCVASPHASHRWIRAKPESTDGHGLRE